MATTNTLSVLQKDKIYKMLPKLLSPDTVWIAFYNQLKSEVGRNDAAAIFLKFWEKQGNEAANTRNLRQVLGADGVVIKENIFDNITDLGGGIGDFFGGVFKIGKVAVIVVGGMLVIGLGMTIFNIARSPDKFIKH